MPRAGLLIVAVLAFSGCAAAQEKPAAVAPADAAIVDGQAVYRRHCLTCHQADGGGVPNMQPAILDSAWVKGDPQALALFIMTGGFDSATRKDSAVDNVMPPFPQLTNDELAALLTYVRQKFGPDAGAVTVEQVAEARKNAPAAAN